MLPVGGVGFARVGGAGDFNTAAGVIGKVYEMSWRLILNGERGEGLSCNTSGAETSRLEAVLRDRAELSLT